MISFNSLQVRYDPLYPFYLLFCYLQFQFLIGTIRHKVEMGFQVCKKEVSIPYRYDTTWVQVRVVSVQPRRVSIPYRYDTTLIVYKGLFSDERFQFLIGTIRLLHRIRSMSKRHSFNSLQVRYDVNPGLRFRSLRICFNSLQVRYDWLHFCACWLILSRFQFLIGTIRHNQAGYSGRKLLVSIPYRYDTTESKGRRTETDIHKFQFLIGTIRPTFISDDLVGFDTVSIPYRYDTTQL